MGALTFKLGTRGSALAMTQAKMVAQQLGAAHPGLEVELVIVKTTGDQKTDVALSAAGGVGLFTKELEEALRRHEIDAAVHSLKDLPSTLAADMHLGAVSKREDWRDAFLSAKYASWQDLPQGALIGTGSPRRRAQLTALRPDLKFTEFRGNVDTRLRKLQEGEVDAAVLACAGLNRLGLSSEIKAIFTADEMLPAPGQGFLGLECRASDAIGASMLAPLNDAQAAACAAAERALMAKLGAGCHAAVACLVEAQGAGLSLRALAQDTEDKSLKHVSQQGELHAGVELGEKAAEAFLKQNLRI